MLASPRDIGEEIVQIALVRGCWFYAEEKFTLRIRAICQQWTDGDRKKAKVLCQQLLRGKTAIVPGQLAFATMPLVNMLLALRKGREHVDAAFKMAVATDPAAKDIVAEIPEGYVSFKEASNYVGVAQVSHLRGAARFIAYARSVRVLNGRQGKSPIFFAVEDLARARAVLEEEQTDKLACHLASLAKRKGLAPLDAIPTFKVAERIGWPTHRLDGLAREHEGQECAHFPKMYRFGQRWFSFEADIVAFLERRSRFEGFRQKGWLDTRAAAARIGGTQSTLIRECRQQGIDPVHFGHHALYSPQDLETIRWIRESRAIEAAARKREREALRLALRGGR